ncbi:hypothetical protein ACFYVR_12405 [Rhodococcus sp. NPDC003318]|uniref:hypothetical protein n=1 Tax=Rhodococcus sp. NPDC003318 TaxID=3364503 RepID=UPI003691C52D
MRRGDWARRLDEIRRASPHGAVRVADLSAEGISGSAVSQRCRTDGPWQRLLPGVVLMQNGEPSFRQREAAALLYSGPDALLTGQAALREHGLGSGSPGDIHVLVPHDRQRQSARFVLIERTTRLPDAVSRNGFACAPLPRATLDAARRMRSLNAVRALVSEVIQRERLEPAALFRELAAGSRRGSALPRVVLAEVAANVHSVAEAQARDLARTSGLPTMSFNPSVHTADGRFLARPDGWIDDVALAWEIDSLNWHLSADDYAATLERRSRLQSHGIVVYAIIPRRLTEEPARVLSELRAHYDLAASRPRPDVRVHP